MIFAHTCLLCGSPCELTLAMSSENCTNPKCVVFAPALKALSEPTVPGNVEDSKTASVRRTLDFVEHSLRDALSKRIGEAHIPEEPPNFNKKIQSAASDLMNMDPVRFLLTQPCTHCRKSMLRIIGPRSVYCEHCRSTYRDIGFDNTIHDEFKLVFEMTVPPRIAKTGFNTNVDTGRLSSKDPNFSNIPRADISLPKHYVDAPPPPPCPGCELEEKAAVSKEGYAEKRLRWANTMRVLDHESMKKKEAEKKDGHPLLGVLSLIDVDLTGTRAMYDYIAIQATGNGSKSSVRLRIEARMREPRRPRLWGEYADALRHIIGDKAHFDIKVCKTYDIPEDFLREVHVMAIALEFEFDRVRARASRRPNLAEQFWFSKLKK